MPRSRLPTFQSPGLTRRVFTVALTLAILAGSGAGASRVWAEAPVPSQGLIQGDAITLEPLASRGGRLYSVIAGGIYFSIDGGTEWKRQPIPVVERLYPASVAVDPADPLTVYLGTNYNSLYKSVDGGITYSRSSTGLGAGTQVAVTAIHLPPLYPGLLLAATAYWVGTSQRDLVPQALYLSTDEGQSWLQFSDAVGATAVTSMALDPAMVVTARSADGAILRIPLDGALAYVMQFGTAEQQAQVRAAVALLGIQTGEAELNRRFWSGEDMSATAVRLAFLGTPAAIRTLVTGLGDTRETARRHISMQTLEFLGEKAVPALITGLSDDNLTIRRYSAEMLGWIASASARPALQNALTDENQAVRVAAAWALTQIV